MNSVSAKNLNRAGRKPLFDEATALQFLQLRRDYGAITIPQFIAKALENGELTKELSVRTFQRLFDGEMFPDLIDPMNDEPYSYRTLPKAPRGHPRRVSEEDPNGVPVRKMSRSKQRLYDRLHFELTKDINEIAGKLKSQLMGELGELERRLSSGGLT